MWHSARAGKSGCDILIRVSGNPECHSYAAMLPNMGKNPQMPLYMLIPIQEVLTAETSTS
jgi:hypothetical protein